MLINKLKTKYEIKSGFSYPVGELFLSFSSRHPFNVDTMRDIQKVHVEVKDEYGQTDNVAPTIKSHRSSGCLTRLDERNGLECETVVVLSIPQGYQKQFFQAIFGLPSLGKQFRITQLKEFREPAVQHAKKKIKAEPEGAEAHHNARGLSAKDSIDSFMFWLMKNPGQPLHFIGDLEDYVTKHNIKPDYMHEFAKRLNMFGRMLSKRLDKKG